MDVLSLLSRQATEVVECTKDTCPVSESIYGYAPSLGANAAFTAIFLLSGIVHLFQGVKYKTWSFAIAMVCGALCEGVGSAGRIMLHSDPFSGPGFKLQICLLTFAPAFLAAGIYLCLKHLVLTFGGHLSRLPAKWYTYIFITCDVISLVLQGAGGGIASGAADGDKKTLDMGNSFMMAGLIFQVITLVLFGLLAGEFALRVWRHRGNLNQNTVELRNSLKFKAFIGVLVVSYFCILLRCVYRIAEMAGGWGNPIMQDEALFIALDSLMCAIAIILLNVLHPGACFDFKLEVQKEVSAGNSGSDLEMQPEK